MSTFDELLQVDQDNVEISKKNLQLVEPQALELIEKCIRAFDFVQHEYGKVCDYDSHQERLEDACSRIPGYSTDVLRLIYSSQLVGKVHGDDPITKAHDAILAELAIMARVLLGLRFGRELRFGITDLLRLRISPSMGILRTQSETVGLMKLIASKPELGRQWLATADDELGKEFHGRWHGSIVAELRKLGFEDHYQRGSNMALHPRASGIALGYLAGKSLAESGRIELVYQEAAKPEKLLLWYTIHMTFCRQVIEKGREIYPELNSHLFESVEVVEFLNLEAEVRKRSAATIGKARSS